MVAGLAAGALSLASAGPAQAQNEPVCGPEVDGAADFDDVADTNVHAAAIDCLVFYEITSGRTATRYEPAAALTRGQAASMIVRIADAAEMPVPPGPDRFPDDDGSVHEDAINGLAQFGVISGFEDGTVRADQELRRGQAASLLIRVIELTVGPQSPADDAFTDDDESVHEESINQAADLGLIEGFPDQTFGPNDRIRRDQAASIVVRAVELLAAELGIDPPAP